MTISTKNNTRALIGITLTSSLLILSACGGDSTDTANVDVSGVTEVALKESLKEGLTDGFSSNMDSLGSSLSNVNSVINDSDSSDNKALNSVAANTDDEIVDGLNGAKGDLVDNLNLIIDNSTTTNVGNVYTFDPDESVICADLNSANQTAKIAECEDVLEHVTFVSTINAVDSNNKVTSSDNDFKYNTSIFSKIGFDDTSSYYQVEFAGLSALLTGMNSVAGPNDQIDIPSTMAGSLKIASSAQSATSGTFSVSVPSAITISDTSPATNLSLGQTSNLFSISADSATNGLIANVDISALDFLTTREDDQGTDYTEQFLLNSLTGNAVVSSNGNTVTLTGVGINSLEFKIDGNTALNASLASMGATINTANSQNQITLDSSLDFDITVNNVNGFIDDAAPATDTETYSVDANSGTLITEVTTNIKDLLKIDVGSLSVVETINGATPTTTTVANGNCLNTDDLTLDNSANCQ